MLWPSLISREKIQQELWAEQKTKVLDSGASSEEVRASVEESIVEAIKSSFFLLLLAGPIELFASLGMRRENLFEYMKKRKIDRLKNMEI